jgi:small subunit ribosomal protein S19
MARSIKKGPYIDKSILKAVEKIRASGQRPQVSKTWSRRSTITPDRVGLTFGVHNGKRHLPICYGKHGGPQAGSSRRRTFKGHSGTKVEKATKVGR